MNRGQLWVPVLSCLLLAARPAAGQSVLDRPPNLSGAWIGVPGTLYFNFLHRFDASDAPLRKVSNSPTFLLAAGAPGRALVGVQYATASDVVPRFPNEWEFFGRALPLAQASGAPLDVGITVGYNQAARSVDGELTLVRRLGPVGLLVAGRALSNGYGADAARFAVAGGATLRLGRYFAIAGDVASLLDREAGEEIAWSAGLQVAIPYTPHTLSLHAANTATGTLQGSSRGTEPVRYGFEFTIPVTLDRYFRRGRAAAPPQTGAPGASAVRIEMQGLQYRPAQIEVPAGTVVEWVNRDPLQHTATGDDGSWDSGLIDPGQSWRRRFERPGTYTFHCTPHPFMTGTVVVR